MARKGSDKSVDELTVAELRTRAGKLEITGRSSMNKSELRQAVVDAEEQLATIEAPAEQETARSARKSTATRKAAAKKPRRRSTAKRRKAEEAKRAQPQAAKNGEPAAEEDDGEPETGDMAAPSIGPHTKIEKEPPEERLAKHEQSDIDAMGLDKRRSVAGGRYGPSLAKQASMYGAFLVVLVMVLIGGKLAVDELDKPPSEIEEQAEWAQDDAQQRPPAPIDFPRNPSP